MNADYSERLIHPLSQRSTRNPPRAVLLSSTRPTAPANSGFKFFSSYLHVPTHNPVSALLGQGIQGRLAGYGPFHSGLKFKAKTRKFAEFSVDGDVAIVRGIPTPLDTIYPRRNMVPKNTYVNDLNFVSPPRLISQPTRQFTTTSPNPEEHDTTPTSQHPATQNLPGTSTSSQPPNGSKSNEPVTNWSQAVLSSCVVGVALVAVAIGCAYASVFRGALSVGQFIYTNRESIRQRAITCTKAVHSTYNAAKRRMVSLPVPRLPVGMRRRYAAPTRPRSRSWRCPLFRRSTVPAQSLVQPSQPINPVASTLAPEKMPGVEYSGLSEAGKLPDTQDAADPDAFIFPPSSNALPSGATYMAGGHFHEPTPSPFVPSPVQEQIASNNLNNNPDAMELIEHPCISYEESVFSDDIEDEYEADHRDYAKVPTAELFKDDEGLMEIININFLSRDILLPSYFKRPPCSPSTNFHIYSKYKPSDPR